MNLSFEVFCRLLVRSHHFGSHTINPANHGRFKGNSLSSISLEKFRRFIGRSVEIPNALFIWSVFFFKTNGPIGSILSFWLSSGSLMSEEWSICVLNLRKLHSEMLLRRIWLALFVSKFLRYQLSNCVHPVPFRPPVAHWICKVAEVVNFFWKNLGVLSRKESFRCLSSWKMLFLKTIDMIASTRPLFGHLSLTDCPLTNRVAGVVFYCKFVP